jgi:hypothetical protein
MAERPRLPEREPAGTNRALGLLVFVLGLVIAPVLHNVGHDGHHSHGLAGAISNALAHPHSHSDHRALLHHHGHGRTAVHDHGHGHAHPAGTREHTHEHGDPRDHDERDHGPDPDHGRGSLEHFGAAVLIPLVFVAPRVSSTLEPPALTVPSSARVERQGLDPIQPRAPPA